jgi:hypothetical protein
MRAYILFALVLLFVGVCALEVVVWHECRTDHSWLYCLRLMSQ